MTYRRIIHANQWRCTYAGNTIAQGIAETPRHAIAEAKQAMAQHANTRTEQRIKEINR
jgi:hypothetical protein